MFNPEKDFHRLLLSCLGKDGKSISALSKELESMGFKHHRLILTGYLRALTDTNILRERSVPPSKIYSVVKGPPENIYETVGRICRKNFPGDDELILFVLSRLFRRPVFDSELRMAGVSRPGGRSAEANEIAECRKILKRAGNTVPSADAYFPRRDYSAEMCDILSEIVLDVTDSRHLVMATKQTRLI
ncbi:MAG: hypothetical protein ACOX8L_03660 [Candidatus Methanomethylophilaceae archaeon]|jgi:hypothetical protein